MSLNETLYRFAGNLSEQNNGVSYAFFDPGADLPRPGGLDGDRPAAATPANGSIGATAAATAAAAAAAASDAIGYDHGGFDSRLADQPFDVQGQQMMDLSLKGLGINVQTPTEALDIAGYMRLRSITIGGVGIGGTILLDGAASSGFLTSQEIYLNNDNGTFRVIDAAWSKQLFSVDQAGNVFALGNIFSNAEIQTMKDLRIIGTDSSGAATGAMWTNDGTNTYLQFTNHGDAMGAASALNPLYIGDATGIVTFPGGLTLGGGGVIFSDNTVQSTAASYGGEYSMVAGACSTNNYRTGGCSCPAKQPNAHQYVNFPVAAGTLAVFACTND